jgi:hypothetical protein
VVSGWSAVLRVTPGVVDPASRGPGLTPGADGRAEVVWCGLAEHGRPPGAQLLPVRSYPITGPGRRVVRAVDPVSTGGLIGPAWILDEDPTEGPQ